MAWTTGRILLKLQLSLQRVQRQSLASATSDGTSGQRLGPIGTLESETGTKLNMEGFPSASKGSYMEILFSKWLQDQNSIHATWQRFFQDLLENDPLASASNTTSGRDDSKMIPLGQQETETQPKVGSVSAIKIPEKMTHQKPPEEPEKAAMDERKAPLRKRRTPKLKLYHKFAKFRKQESTSKKTDQSLHRAQRIPGSKNSRKWRSKDDSRKNNTEHFKSFYEEKLNKEKAKQLKRKPDGVKDISKENKLPEQPDLKLPSSHLGEEVSYPMQKPPMHRFESLEAIIQDLDKDTINMALSDPIHQEGVKKVQLRNGDEASKLLKMPSDMKSFTDLPKAMIDHTEKSYKSEKSSKSEKSFKSKKRSKSERINEDKASEAAGPEPENLTERQQSTPCHITNKKPQLEATKKPQLEATKKSQLDDNWNPSLPLRDS